MRDRRLRHRDGADDLADGARTVAQAAEYVHAAGRCQRLHHLRHPHGHRAGHLGATGLALDSVAHLSSAYRRRRSRLAAPSLPLASYMQICSCYHVDVNGSTPALLAAAAGVGFGHAILPDHWVPLAVVGRTQRHPLRRIARLSLLAAAAHVIVSILLG